jgi:hypothetical protein
VSCKTFTICDLYREEEEIPLNRKRQRVSQESQNSFSLDDDIALSESFAFSLDSPFKYLTTVLADLESYFDQDIKIKVF